MRINARLDEQSGKNLAFIRQTTGESTTEALKHALADYADGLRANALRNNRALLQELAGIGGGPENLSENYKHYLKESFGEKQHSG